MLTAAYVALTYITSSDFFQERFSLGGGGRANLKTVWYFE